MRGRPAKLSPADQHELRRYREAGVSRKRQGYVYVFAAGELVKVGHSGNPHKRWLDIRSANPYLEPPVYVSPRIEEPEKAESETRAWMVREGHQHFHGEWFKCDREAAVKWVKVMAGVK